MKKHYLSYRLCRCAAAAALCTLVSACSMSDGPECPGGHEAGGVASASMKLSLGIPSGMPPVRAAAPSGGENGDGEENGQDYENAVSDALVFLLPPDTDVNAGEGTRILDVLYFSSFRPDGGRWLSEPVETEVEAGAEYPVIVVANPGDRTWAASAGLTLGSVRDHIHTGAWRQAPDGGCSYFLMSSESGGSVTFTEGSSEDAPSVAAVDVERVAARVDYKAEASYTCTDPAYAGCTVTIEGAALVNDLTAGSYLLKRVASSVGGTCEYLGDETPQTGVQTNYVIDPWTADKTAANSSSGTPFTLPGGTSVAASGLYGLYYNDREAEDPSAWKDIVKEGTPVKDPVTGAQWMRVGYTLENTTDAAEAGKAYSTGVVFRAGFVPSGLSSEYFGVQYRAGLTFFAVGETLYASLEDVMLSTVSRSAFDLFYETIDTQIGTYGDLRTKVLGKAGSDLTGYKAWLTGRIDGKGDGEEVAQDDRDSLAWRSYAEAELGYKWSSGDGGYSISVNQGGKETRAALISEGVRTYENANCYYTYWIRHSGDDTAQKDEDGFFHNVMGHAIVRNNIYKISVTSVSSLGGDVPDPDISPTVSVWADKWTLLPGEDISM